LRETLIAAATTPDASTRATDGEGTLSIHVKRDRPSYLHIVYVLFFI